MWSVNSRGERCLQQMVKKFQGLTGGARLWPSGVAIRGLLVQKACHGAQLLDYSFICPRSFWRPKCGSFACVPAVPLLLTVSRHHVPSVICKHHGFVGMALPRPAMRAQSVVFSAAGVEGSPVCQASSHVHTPASLSHRRSVADADASRYRQHRCSAVR